MARYLEEPLQVISEGWSKDASLDHLSRDFQSAVANSVIPSLDTLPVPQWSRYKHKLVKFRGMVQDTTLAAEVYATRSTATNGNKICNLFTDSTDHQAEPDLDNLGERNLLFCVNVPGENKWAKKIYNAPTDQSLDSLTLEDPTDQPEWLSKKFPTLAITNRAILVKTYTEDDQLQSTTIAEFTGVLDSVHFNPSSDLEVPEASETPPQDEIFTLHSIFHHKSEAQQILENFPKTREDRDAETLVNYLASLLNDKLSAEFLLLALVSRTYSRRDSLLLGHLSINLSWPLEDSVQSDALVDAIADLVPVSQTLELSLKALNDPARPAYQPVSASDLLSAGQLQLPRSSTLIAHELAMVEGTLQDRGVKNIRALSRIASEQKLAYNFPFSDFDFQTDFNLICLSKGKSLLPIACVVPVEASKTEAIIEPTSEQLDSWRRLIQEARYADFVLSKEMSKHIEDDFVLLRQNSGPNKVGHEDLMLRVTIARLYALSRGESEMTKELYAAASALDDRRRARLEPAKQSS